MRWAIQFSMSAHCTWDSSFPTDDHILLTVRAVTGLSGAMLVASVKASTATTALAKTLALLGAVDNARMAVRIDVIFRCSDKMVNELRNVFSEIVVASALCLIHIAKDLRAREAFV